MKPKLIIIRGLPGSGKSTYAKKHYPHFLHLENDQAYYTAKGEYAFDEDKVVQCRNYCSKLATYALNLGVTVVVSNVFVSRQSVMDFKRIAGHAGADFEVIRLETKHKTIHNVPDAVYQSMKERFEDFKEWDGINEKVIKEETK